jgi:hypothetical protein
LLNSLLRLSAKHFWYPLQAIFCKFQAGLGQRSAKFPLWLLMRLLIFMNDRKERKREEKSLPGFEQTSKE